jgi:hypothetical protein
MMSLRSAAMLRAYLDATMAQALVEKLEGDEG